MDQIQPFQFEPEYSTDEEEFDSPVSSQSSTETTEQVERVSRLGERSWCQCGGCAAMPTEKECVCCKELRFLLPVIEVTVVLRQYASIEMCFGHHWSYRYASYRQFTWWIHGWLGKKIHRVIPSCAVSMIRSVFPEDDGVYVGYKEGDDDDEDDMAIEVEEAWRDFLDL
ncbi:hypothetical protein QZH41_006888 [Actinostola sp. cb2023]|nr:hypothetical protein QZH41_006888 [Actinostola sp. cb2023]